MESLFSRSDLPLTPPYGSKWSHKIADLVFLPYICFIIAFYPTALKGCRGIVFPYGVRMGGRAGVRAGGRREIVCPGCISETVRCRKLILGRDIG